MNIIKYAMPGTEVLIAQALGYTAEQTVALLATMETKKGDEDTKAAQVAGSPEPKAAASGRRGPKRSKKN
jgi:hypothetical protein